MPKKQSQKYKKELRIAKSTSLYLQGNTQQQIADTLKKSVATIQKDLNIARERWKKSSLVDIDERIGAELEKIDNLEMFYMIGYRNSQRKKTKKTIKQIPIFLTKEGKLFVNTKGELEEDKMYMERKGELVTEENITIEQKPEGDPKFLDGIHKCINLRLTLLGLNAKKSVPDGDEGFIRIPEQNTKAKIAFFLTIIKQYSEGNAGTIFPK